MASLQMLAERQRSEEQVRSLPRTIVIAHDRTLGVLTIRNDDAKAMVRSGLLYECGTHDLHLVAYREWDLDDMERILAAVSRYKSAPVPAPHAPWPTDNVVELRKRVVPVYDPAPLSVGEEKPAQPKRRRWIARLLFVTAGLWFVASAAYFIVTGVL